jgi:hypothetical protein
LAALLDPVHPLGRDVSALAAALGQPAPDRSGTTSDVDTHKPSGDGNADSSPDHLSPTDAMLNAWCPRQLGQLAAQPKMPLSSLPTIREFHSKLVTLERPDVVETLLSATPIYRYHAAA